MCSVYINANINFTNTNKLKANVKKHKNARSLVSIPHLMLTHIVMIDAIKHTRKNSVHTQEDVALEDFLISALLIFVCMPF